MLKIEKKITGYAIKKDQEPVEIETMHEGIDRPDVLIGSTYKIKPTHLDHAVYITINDMVLDGKKHPFEIFINSKNMDSFQWVLAITRLISAIWRKGGNTDFLIDELKAVCDPHGGYWSKVNGKGKYMTSIVAEIGYIIDRHVNVVVDVVADDNNQPITNATTCPKCNAKSLVLMDGCETCLECGFSKCG
jgi:hypothetical protein